MSDRQIGTCACNACGFERARVKTGKNETLSISCSECGSLTMVKSPKAVAALKSRLGVAPADAAPANKKSFGDFLKL
jgi:uncharacterized Zn finger protein